MSEKIKLLNGKEVSVEEFYSWSLYRQRLNLDPELNNMRKHNAPKHQWRDWTGNKHSDDTKRKIAEANKRRAPVSEETRRKMSATRKGLPAPMLGKKMSEEGKRKLAEASRALWADPTYRAGQLASRKAAQAQRKLEGKIAAASAATKKRQSAAQKHRQATMSTEQRTKISQSLSEAGKKAWARRKAAKEASNG